MEHSKTYYIVRGICRFLVQAVIAFLVLGFCWVFYMVMWAMS